MSAYLHISVYTYMAHGASGSGTLPAPQAPALEEWRVEIGESSVQSLPLPENATFVMLRPDVDCCLAFGADPKAQLGVHPASAGERLWYGMHPTHRIAVIDNS